MNKETAYKMVERILTLLQDLLEQFLSVIPNVFGAIIVFFIGWMIAKIVARIIKRAMSAIGIDKLAEQLNDIEIVQKTNVKVVPSTIVSKIIYYVLLLIFSIVSAEILQVEPVSQLVLDILNYIPLVISAALVLMIGILVAEALKNIVLTTTQSLGIPSAKIIASFVFYFILLISLVTALTQIGIDTDFLSTNLSVIIAGAVLAFAIGYGLASKDTMSNYLASFYSKDRFIIGDVISINGVKGEIIRMDNNSLTLQSENSKVIIPLSILSKGQVEIFGD